MSLLWRFFAECAASSRAAISDEAPGVDFAPAAHGTALTEVTQKSKPGTTHVPDTFPDVSENPEKARQRNCAQEPAGINSGGALHYFTGAAALPSPIIGFETKPNK